MRLPSKATCANPGAFRQHGQPCTIPAHKCIPHICPWADGANTQSLGKLCWKIFQAVNGQINATLQKRIFNLFSPDYS